MPYTNTTPSLPWSGSDETSKQCSFEAAVSASKSRAMKTERYKQYLMTVGRASDQQAAKDLGWGISSINSIRNGLGKLVTSDGKTDGQYRQKVTLWRLVRITKAMCEGEEA